MADNDYAVPNGFGDYMRNKQAKLQEQYVQLYGSSCDTPPIFARCVIYTTGYTEPSADTLKRLIVAHGGRFTLYHSSKTTHVVCTALPLAKRRLLNKADLIVKPAWIVDSVAAATLLPVDTYLVYSALRDEAQAVLPFAARRAAAQESFDAKRDPRGFIRHFYEQSRLHHLSTWKSELQADLQRFVAAKSGLRQIPSARAASTSQRRVLLYVDLDQFFSAVSLAARPELRGQPVVVCHSGKDALGMSDVASASYAARKFGIRNGMWFADARKLCPHVVCLPYDFPAYEKASRGLYQCLLQYSVQIEVRSCDEAICALDGSVASAIEVATALRADIEKTTPCVASIGVGDTIMAAKVACSLAKPSSDGTPGKGVFEIRDRAQLQELLDELPLRKLPGVGYRTAKRLKEMVRTREGISDADAPCCVRQMRSLTQTELQREFGAVVGRRLFERARGIDRTELKCRIERKSLGAEINFGIRFETIAHVSAFVHELTLEVLRRLRKANVRGQKLTLTIMQRKPDAPVKARKFLGHGRADSFSKTTRLVEPTSDADIIESEAMALYRRIGCPPADLRGIGIHLSMLQQGFAVEPRQRSVVKLFANQNDATASDDCESDVECNEKADEQDAAANDDDSNPPQSQIDPQVWKELPKDVRQEIKQHYQQQQKEEEEEKQDRAAPPRAIVRRQQKPKRKKAAATNQQTSRKKPKQAAAKPASLRGVVPRDILVRLNGLLRRQLQADVMSGAAYLREIDFSVLAGLDAPTINEILRAQRNAAIIEARERRKLLHAKQVAERRKRLAAEAADNSDALSAATQESNQQEEPALASDVTPSQTVVAPLLDPRVGLRTSIRRWLQRRAAGAQSVAVLAATVRQLFSTMRLDVVQLLLYEMRRHALTSADRQWRQSFDAILAETQVDVAEKYGGHLAFDALDQ